MPTDDTNRHHELFRPLPPADADAWREAVTRDLGGRGPETLRTTLYEGIALRPLYTRADALAPTGFPGLAPYTRGASVLPESVWTSCQEHDAPDPADAARDIRADLARGVRGIWLAFSPELRGGGRSSRPDTHAAAALDERDDAARGIVIRDARDVDTLLGDIPLGETYLVVEAGEGASVVAGLLGAHAAARGVDTHELRGCLGCDPLGALALDGRLPTSLEDGFGMMSDLAAWCRADAPGLRPVLVDVRAYHDAGATAVDELAYALATATAYLRRLTGNAPEPGGPSRATEALSLTEAARAISFAFAVGRDLFVETAKLRAARTLWAKILRASGTGDDPPPMHLHARTSRRTKTRRDLWVNALRVTTETVAAAWGGANVVTTAPYDETLGRSDTHARRLASNTQQILARESHLGRIGDPLGGSWYVEHLTDALARAAWERFQAIEALGGMEIAITRGEVQKRTNVAAEQRDHAIAVRRHPIVGVSIYANPTEPAPPQPSPRATGRPSGSGDRAPSSAAAQALARLRTGTDRSPGGLTRAVIEAARRGARVPELVAALVSGSDAATAPRLRRRRDAARFERLRDRTDRLADRGERPSVFLATLGPRRVHGARAVFARRFLEVAGLAIVEGEGTEDPATAADGFVTSGARAAVICSSDELYATLAEPTARALREKGASVVILAGRPDEHEKTLREAGVDLFIHLGADALEILEGLLDTLGGAS
jgi:methylmalonyl-CoA mutase